MSALVIGAVDEVGDRVRLVSDCLRIGPPPRTRRCPIEAHRHCKIHALRSEKPR